MDDSDYLRNRGNEYLGVNKIGKNIRKSPLHQPNYANSNSNLNPPRQQPQPQVYNINKNDFQSIVQQLTGSPSRNSQEPLPRPQLNSPKPSSMRLQRFRPSPLTPLNVARPRMPQEQMPPHRPPVPFNGNLARPPHHGQPRPQQAMAAPPMNSGQSPGWTNTNTNTNTNTAESPISAYMRYLQHSIVDSAQHNTQSQSQSQMQSQQQQHQHKHQQSAGLLQYPLMPPLPSPRMSGPLPPLPSPRMSGPLPPLPSPTSQYLLPSPSGYLNLLSPRSPYPLLSPGYQHPPPLTPNFSFSPMTQPGFMGPGPPPPPSPGMGFPSPGFFSIASPRWRE